MDGHEQTRWPRLWFCVVIFAFAAGSRTASCQDLFDYVPNLPYTAQVVATHLEALADGTRVPRENRLVQMRDSQGRTRIESFTSNSSGCGHADGEPGSGPHGIVNLYVPLRRQFIQLLTWQKTARVMTFPGTGPIPRHGPNLNAIRTTTESVPGKTIHGIYAIGTRTTEVLPSDVSGPDIVDTQETWVSPDLGIVVRGKFTSTDPRSSESSSESSSEIQKLERNEPDAALFDIPADYKIVTVSLEPQADPPPGAPNTEQPARQP